MAADAGEMIALDQCNQAAGFGMGLLLVFVVVALVIGIIVGFILGTRARKMMAALAALAKAAMKAMSGKPSESAAGMEGADDDVEEEEDKKRGDEIEIDDFLSSEPGLDLHPELELNPIMMYKMKQAKEASRREMAVRALVMEGVPEDEAQQRIADGEEAGLGTGPVKRSAIQLLIDVGARVTSASTTGNSESVMLDNLRRQKRNVDVYLNKEFGVDTELKKAAAGPSNKSIEKKLQGTMDAGEKALDTKMHPHGETELRRMEKTAGDAKNARLQLARLLPILEREGRLKAPSPDLVEVGEKRADRAAQKIDAADLAKLALELEEEGEEDDEEGEEGEEGDELEA